LINRDVCWRKQACCIVLRVGALRWASLDGARDWLILAIGKPTRLQFSSEVRVPGPEGPEETSSTAAELRIMLPFAAESPCNCKAVRQRLGLKGLLTRWLVGDAGWISYPEQAPSKRCNRRLGVLGSCCQCASAGRCFRGSTPWLKGRLLSAAPSDRQTDGRRHIVSPAGSSNS